MSQNKRHKYDMKYVCFHLLCLGLICMTKVLLSITLKPFYRLFKILGCHMNATSVFLLFYPNLHNLSTKFISLARGFFKMLFLKIFINFPNKIHIVGLYTQHARLSEFKAHLATSQCRELCRGCQPRQ